MQFRPCIDLREGKVVQIVGGSLRDDAGPETNFVAERAADEFARMYARDGLTGGHVISLGPGNKDAAMSALRAFPGGFHVGGGVTPENAAEYLDAGASHVIATSYVFSDGQIDSSRLDSLVKAVGKERLVLDLSCRKKEFGFWIVTDRWQKFTSVQVTQQTLEELSVHCDEFLVHGVDVEGKMAGIERELVQLLGDYSPIPTTYAGGVRSLADLDLVAELAHGQVDATVGSALDIFGGTVPYEDVVAWHRAKQPVAGGGA
jgi:phosphoribosylformimino-5-aminoimidazole carboxamide ribotide isomerase